MSDNGPISEVDFKNLALAAKRWLKVRATTRLATFNAVSLAVVAAMVFLGALGQFIASATSGQASLGGMVGFVLAIAIAGVAAAEFRGRSRLLKLDPGGATLLGWNQLVLLAMVALYCGWKVAQGVAGPNPYEDAIRQNPELADMLRPIVDAYGTITLAVYLTVLAVSAVFQGYCARRYFLARRYTQAYLATTQPWMVRILRLAS